jgi:hypothetical protein
MASSSDAFEKFETWRKSKTSLKVTLIVEGRTDEVLMGKIFFADSEASQIGFSNPLVMHSAACFDVEDVSFSIEESRLVATRNESDWIVFEEVDELSPIWSPSK